MPRTKLLADAAPAAPTSLPAEPPVAELSSAEPTVSELPVPSRLGPLSRRQALKLGCAAVAGLVGSKLAFDWLSAMAGPAVPAVDAAVAGYDPTVHRWGFVVDTTTCIGCGQCVVACKRENNVPLDAEHTRTWVERHSFAPDGTVSVDAPEAGIHGYASTPPAEAAGNAAATRAHFVPRLCMQCENSPCTSVCPVGATYRTPDGVILVDANRCIGCGYCVIACPYGARYLVPAGARTPTGTSGVADKCTFCYHRITHGQEPACVEVCPVGARLFGDLNDPESRVSAILASRPTRVMKERLGTRPRVHYLGLEEAEA